MAELTAFDLSYAGTGFNDHKDEERYDLVQKIAAKVGGRWEADFDTAADLAHFRRRPVLPERVPHPGVSAFEGLPWNVLPFAPGCAFDLLKTSHILVIGATNAGKTALMRSLIAKIAYDARRGEVTARLGDPKRVELIGFRGWPGIESVATTDGALWDMAVEIREEMERRYELYETRGVPLDSHPRLIMLIDEYEDYVDNMITFAGEPLDPDDPKSQPRERITQKRPPAPLRANAAILRKARRCGIHCIFGTQRPDADFFGGRARDNMQGRAAVGRMTAEASRMAFGTSVHGRDVPAGLKGRTTVQIGDGAPFETQAWWTPCPAEAKSAEDLEILARLRA